MAAFTPQGAGALYGFRRGGRFDKGLAALLPAAYKKFWVEWKETKPAAVHYIPKEGNFVRNDVTGQVTTVQNVPIPLIFPPEHNDAIWGGEGIIKGFQKRTPLKRRVPHFWVPVLRRSVVRSDVLNQFLSITVTDRTLSLIHDNHGFDHYLLKTPACDLRSTLALKLKQKILSALLDGCPEHADNPSKQEAILKEYKPYLAQYTPEEIEWYGLTFAEALKKMSLIEKRNNPIVPYKIKLRQEVIENMKQMTLKQMEAENENNVPPSESKSWLSNINPFAKKQET